MRIDTCGLEPRLAPQQHRSSMTDPDKHPISLDELRALASSSLPDRLDGYRHMPGAVWSRVRLEED